MNSLIRTSLFTFSLMALIFLMLPAQASAAGMDQLAIHPYMGVGIGAYGLRLSEPGYSQNNTVFGGYVNAGLAFNDYLAAELRLGTTAKGSKDNGANAAFPGSPPFTMDQQADYFLSYLAKLQYPATQDLHLYALVGATTAKIKQTFSVVGIGLSQSATRTGFTYGFGGAYNINNQLSAGLEWTSYLTDTKYGNNVKYNLWGAVATLAYNF